MTTAGNHAAVPKSNHVYTADEQVGRQLFLLIDEFEQFLEQCSRVPLTGKIIMDEDDAYGFLDHLRRTIPAEIRRALDILAERDRILERAESQAETMVAEARQYAEQLTSEAVITRQAEEEAGRILAVAREEARELRRDADAYAAGVLGRLEEVLEQALQQVRRGREYLEQPTAEHAASDQD